MSDCLSHPYGVKPLGNAFLAPDEVRMVRQNGLGRFACIKDDELLLELLSFLSFREVVALNCVSRAFYVYSMHNELWRDITLRSHKGDFFFTYTWKDTFAAIHARDKNMQHMSPASFPTTKEPSLSTKTKTRPHNPIHVNGIYSHALHRSWVCRNINLESECKDFLLNNIERRKASDLSCQEFVSKYEQKNVPLIITEVVNKWPAYKKWSDEYLSEKCGDFSFRATSATAAGTANFTMKQYVEYAKNTIEEAPLYLFERDFNSISSLRDDYSVPAYFSPDAEHGADLFRLLGDRKRPDFKWLVVGPERSGSIFHIDPNQTNAWNGLIRGRKKWIFYPPGVTPPGVTTSNDGADVTEPISTGEWCIAFWKYHEEARNHPNVSKRPLECILEAGELIFVPHNWWHMVINLEYAVAITHNYVSSSNLVDCLNFLKNKEDQISGVRDRPGEAVQADQLYKHFTACLSEKYPNLLSVSLQSIESQTRGEKIKPHNVTKSRNIIGKKKKLNMTYSDVDVLGGDKNNGDDGVIRQNMSHVDDQRLPSKKFQFAFPLTS